MRAIGIIPARYSSTRFPGKPLIDIFGKTMIQRVYEKASKAKYINEVYAATDDIRIFENVKDFGGKVLMTSAKHKTGTDRICEAADIIGLKDNDILVNIQGDEPFIEPLLIDSAIEPLLKDNKLNVSTIAVKMRTDFDNINKVKVVADKNGYAIYFSRLAIPFNFKELSNIIYYKHQGLYVYRWKFLKKFREEKQSLTEKAESLEQLRILNMGEKIKLIISKKDSISIDTREDLEKIKRIKS